MEINHQLGRYAKLCCHASHITFFAIHGVDDGDVLIHQLTQVLVPAGDRDLNTLAGSHMCQGGDHVIGLHARYVQHGPAHAPHEIVDGLNLRAQIVGHGAAVLFVFGVQLVAKGRAFRVEHASRKVGREILAQPLHHVDHAANGTGGLAVRVAGYGTQIRHGMEGPVQITGAVNQQQGLEGGVFAHPPIVHGRMPFTNTANRPRRIALPGSGSSVPAYNLDFDHLPDVTGSF